MSQPLGFWTEKDIWEYIREYDLPYSKVYDMGYRATGCMYCMFGIMRDKCPNRFQRMLETHPKHYDHCMNKLNLKMVLEHLKIPYEKDPGQNLLDWL